MEKREYSYEEIKTYYAFCEKQHISDDMKHQLYVCFILGINEKYIEQLRDEKISAEKRELLKEALLNDFPEEIYNSMLLSEDVSSCRQIRENYLMEKYAENNPALKKAEEQVKEFHKLLEQYKYRIESNEELAKAIAEDCRKNGGVKSAVAFRSAQGSKSLEEILTKEGFDFTDVSTYSVGTDKDAIENFEKNGAEKKYSRITFSSGSGVKIFFEEMKNPQSFFSQDTVVI